VITQAFSREEFSREEFSSEKMVAEAKECIERVRLSITFYSSDNSVT